MDKTNNKINNKTNNKTKNRFLLIFISFIISSTIISIMISGCIGAKDVPIIKVNATLVERDGIVEAENIIFTQENVSYLNRPQKTHADSFPAIGARTTILKGKDSIIGPWEMVSYKGSGNYSFNIGFRENYYPTQNESIHISIMIVDKKGERIGYIIKDIVWK